MIRIIILLFIFLLFNKCNDISTVEEINDEIAINLILKADSEKQTALLTYIQKVDEESINYQFINNVTLIDSADFFINDIKLQNILTDSIKNNRECYSNLPRIDKCFNYFSENTKLVNNGINTLQIKIDNKIITGETIMPGDFTISLEDKKLSWTSSSNASLYRISVWAQNEQFVQPFEQATFDTVITLNIKDFKPDAYRIMVEAIDENFFNFIMKENFQAGLQNAYGVFGSVRTKKITANIE